MDSKTKQREPIRVDIARAEMEDAIFRQIDELKYISAENRETANRINEAVGHFENAKRIPVTRNYVISIERRSWVTLSVFAVMICCMVLLAMTVRSQNQSIARLEENDLKYRYIRMKNGITAGELEELRVLFYYKKDKKAIKEIRESVENFERITMELAETEARASVNAEKAERLRNEAEKIKK